MVHGFRTKSLRIDDLLRDFCRSLLDVLHPYYTRNAGTFYHPHALCRSLLVVLHL